ncbi:hypothetical protein [uncultured Porphyromonas sp.]|jgi:hypothetical protein|uniref:hypothetical protein n=1 Tax=uncultured Porphyromonas sp. TaxID=159274 RepID=UPI00263187BB|nr:hypothetical protein [uncultured Porphyromonas sp.]
MNKRICYLLALVLSTCVGLVGCYRECPDDGGDPNKEDSIQIGEYKPIYELDAHGNLKYLPIPSVDFTAGELALKKWEAAHGAVLQTEKISEFKDRKVKSYVFNTQDKSGKQPLRIYLVGDAGQGKLQVSTLLLDRNLVYTKDGTIRQEFDMMTINDGFEALDDSSSKTPMYRKGNLVLGVSLADTPGFAQLSFIPMPGSVATGNFNKSLKDFPFASKKAKETSLDEIRKYEAALGLRQEKAQSDPKRANFITKDKQKGNFDLVAYYPQGYTSNGDTYKPGILALSYALTIDMLESNPDVAEWFVRNGFSKPKKSDISDKTFTSENDYYTLLIMEGGQGIAFSFSAKEEAPTPDPAEDTSIFPTYNFGEKFNPADVPTKGTPAGSIYTSEIAKGENVTYNAPGKDDKGNIDYSSANLQVLMKDPFKDKTAAINGYYYYPSYEATEATMHVYDNGGLAINHAKQFKTGIDKELKAALEKGGYQYTGTEKSDSGTEYWFYYNAKHKVSLHVFKYSGSSFLLASFWPGNDYKPQAGKQIRLNTRYLRR